MRRNHSCSKPAAVTTCIALLSALSAIFTLAGCQSIPSASPVPPALRLVAATELQLPSDCVASGSFVVNFTVTANGDTADIRVPAGPLCVQQALTAWVQALRFEPPSVATPTAIEWMMVTAPRARTGDSG